MSSTRSGHSACRGCKQAPRFHDVQLSGQVLRARHALAIDETRLKFAPTFWEAPADRADAPTEDPRVKQVWFEGAHSDVGGGYRDTGLSDTSLLWMAREAHAAGLVFDVPLLSPLRRQRLRPDPAQPAQPDVQGRQPPPRGEDEAGRQGRGECRSPAGSRLIRNERALSVRVASSAVTHFQEGGYEPANLTTCADDTQGFADIVEPVTALPERGVDLTPLGGPPAPTVTG